MQDTIKNMNQIYNDKKIILPIVVGNIFQSWKDISHFKSEGNYCKMVTIIGENHMITKPLKWVEERLTATCFYRVHKSYLVNIYHINKYHKASNGSFIMHNGQIIPISRNIREDISLLINIK